MFPPESIGGAPLPELPFFLPLLSRIACASALPSNYAANDVDPLCESSNFPDIVKLHRKIFMLPLFLQTRPSNSNRSKKSKNRILWKGRREKRRKKSRFNCVCLDEMAFSSLRTHYFLIPERNGRESWGSEKRYEQN